MWSLGGEVVWLRKSRFGGSKWWKEGEGGSLEEFKVFKGGQRRGLVSLVEFGREEGEVCGKR